MKKSACPTREASMEEHTDLAAMLRDSDESSLRMHFPDVSGTYAAAAPPLPKQPGTLSLPSSGGRASTRLHAGPARTSHFDIAVPSPARMPTAVGLLLVQLHSSDA
ncbi:hypothetical protein FRC10_011772 [Ceratobasidium sp. 414]|nr:hypothetical protein FRC10_011772 [Ceratobasidium sp. 414]